MTAGRYVTATAIYRNHAVSDFQAFHLTLNMQILQAGLLLLSKIANLTGGEANRFYCLRINFIVSCLYRLRGNSYTWKLYMIKTLRIG